MKNNRNPSQKYLKQCLDYNPDTGVFTWKVRPLEHFKNSHGMRIFNSQRSGKAAGNEIELTKYRKKYIQIRCSGLSSTAHRLAWIYIHGAIPLGMEIDHKNGDGTDNRICNLRIVTRAENGKNIKKKSNNTSGFNGVSWSREKCKWSAQITVNGKVMSLGRFKNINDAIEAREKANDKYGFYKNHGQDRPL